ncbi:MAG: hypothetical protein ACFFBD_22560 [Candidatus Hodarchaeota archaeon]
MARTLFVQLWWASLDPLLTLKVIFSERITSNNFKRLVRTVYSPVIFNKPNSCLNLRGKVINWAIERKTCLMLKETPIRTLELLFRYYSGEIELENTIQLGINLFCYLMVEDRITPITLARDLVSRLNNAKLVEFDKFGHVSPNLHKKRAQAIMLDYSTFLSTL